MHSIRLQPIVAAICALAGLLWLAGCAPETAQWSGVQAPKRNQVNFVRVSHEVRFGHGDQLSQAEVGQLTAFLQRQHVGPDDRVSLVSLDNAKAQKQRRVVAEALRRLGYRMIPPLPTEGAAAQTGSVTVVVARYVVTPPPCPNWSRESGYDPTNTEASNFGCADAYNLGLMVANPRDLVSGRELPPADGDASTLGIQRYREGKVTPLQGVDTLTGGISASGAR